MNINRKLATELVEEAKKNGKKLYLLMDVLIYFMQDM